MRIARGHPEGLLEAFANLYRDTADNGAAGFAFIIAAIESRATTAPG